ncbi:MAG TPA: Maf family protein [candidate division Zixibacteria bacterium]|nr:septum formation protein Maf [candidate division Zixibacteria bacterium]MDD4916913.1 Maf family protein [candidate division Zixibacteria bacterium]MDM7972145.1 Maf family protein [candidate division Zixibacteria bacterium]HOD66723.1 Maf family protein [candidate division Zixibacteria bacterium]HOZ08353.1 Maf family protein [candidate division Zixibacteria bacterium]
MAYPQLERLARRRRLVLGSRSPRRLTLLRGMGVAFDQLIPEVEERRLPGEPPLAYACRLAEDKARWLMPRLAPDQVGLTCDTIVILGDDVLEKPSDSAEALAILSALSGTRHVVSTAIAWTADRRLLASGYETTEVYFRPVTAAQLRDYIATGEPMDKAGAYGIQGMGAFLVDRIDGNLDTVIGLPRTLVEQLAGEAISQLEHL